MSNEIVDDLKLSNLEISEELGIRLTSHDANIKHTITDTGGSLNIKSDGVIYIEAGYYGDIVSTEAGNVNISSGIASGVRNAGDIKLEGGSAENGNGGDIKLYGGDTTFGEAGSIKITGGLCLVSGNGGDIEIEAGEASNGYGGDLTLYAGSAGGVTGGVAGGNVFIKSGASNDGITGSYVEIKGGEANTTGGNVNIYSGDGNINNNGNINMTGKEIHLNGKIIYNMNDISLEGTNNSNNRIPLETVITKLKILSNTTGLMYIDDGENGQMKIITVKTDEGGITGNITLTGDNTYFNNIIFNNSGDTVSLIFIANDGWIISSSAGSGIDINY